MLKLHLVRHGETNWNAERRTQGQSESELTALGREQAAVAAANIEQIEFSSIYSSTSVRTRQTTEILMRNIKAELTCMDELRELKLGPWEGQLWDDLEANFPAQVGDFRNNPHLFQLDGAETYQQLQQRGMAAVESIIERELQRVDSGDVLIVSHGAIIKALLTGFAKVDLSNLWAPPSLGNCSRSVIHVDREGLRDVVTIADVAVETTEWYATRAK